MYIFFFKQRNNIVNWITKLMYDVDLDDKNSFFQAIHFSISTV